MMDREKVTSELSVKTPSKIILLVMDGLGGLPINGQTALQAAKTPNLDTLASQSVCGLTDPVFMGITPGSGPAHLSLFGYDPTRYTLGRGILEAMGIGVDVGTYDLVARGNFATLKDGLITDRRAGRIPSDENAALCEKINLELDPIEETEVTLFPGKEHRFVVRFRGRGLTASLSDADPQKNNKPPVFTLAQNKDGHRSAKIVNAFIDKTTDILQGSPRANSILLRGFSKFPSLPTMDRLFQLNPVAVAHYPMYRGLAKLVGMKLAEVGPTIEDVFSTTEKVYAKFNFFYLHVKKPDAAGEDGCYEEKIKAISETDTFIPRLLALKPDVLVVTSDHSTPCLLKSHSWHPNPFLLHSRTAQQDQVSEFSEIQCASGYLGRFPALYAMTLILAHAEKLKKYGA
ncbi:2,3-bisphosphoglycerate-independent phosphoglycerate mutase [Acidobacteriota bacterium]